MTSVETYRGSVYPWEADHMDHMNVQFYVAKFDEATWQFFAMIGMTPSFLRQENRGMAAIEQVLKYRRELLPGDLVVVRTRLLEMSNKTIRFHHAMENVETGEEAASAEMLGVHIDRDARKSCPFPETVRAAGRRLLAVAS